MGSTFFDEPMIEAFVFETSQNVETLEQIMIACEKVSCFSDDSINEIFRFMHTIKGSSAMMMYNDIATLSHKLEDAFYLIRETKKIKYDFNLLVDLILESIDYFKIELMKIKNKENPDGNSAELIDKVSDYLEKMRSENGIKSSKKETTPSNKQKYYISPNQKNEKASFYKARIYFKEDSEMENVRSYTVIHNITEMVDEIFYKPNDIIESDYAADEIRINGFLMAFKSKTEKKKLKEYLNNTIFLKKLSFDEIKVDEYAELSKNYQAEELTEEIKIPKISKKYLEKELEKQTEDRVKNQEANISTAQSIISVSVDKLDKLMDMVGELVISEAMVSQNPEIKALGIESFEKSSRQLHKISCELQDMVMGIRMVPLANTFMKMHRIVRDMSKKLDKNVELKVFGEETEVDKNIIEKIADPLMHIIRNSLDHGIENSEHRNEIGKNPQGTITLEAKNTGSSVLILIKDDGKGLEKEAIYEKALQGGLVRKSFEEMTSREIYSLIMFPGFSTKEKVTEFSGRGVGMDVVSKNIESVGGTVIVDSEVGIGTTIVLKIPLTLAIIEGMNIKVGEARFTVPIVAIRESFRAKNEQVFTDTEGQEMIMVRGNCYPILRLHEFYNLPTQRKKFDEGILIMVEDDEKSCCLFADELIGQQQVVVKSLPNYVKKYKQIKGLGGCTLLGDGSISLILNIGDFNLSNVNKKETVRKVKVK